MRDFIHEGQTMQSAQLCCSWANINFNWRYFFLSCTSGAASLNCSMQVSMEANQRYTEKTRRKPEKKQFVLIVALDVKTVCCYLQADGNVTRTMRDSVWTEGKPQSPPQHLSSMAAAMLDSWKEPVTSWGTCHNRAWGGENMNQMFSVKGWDDPLHIYIDTKE